MSRPLLDVMQGVIQQRRYPIRTGRSCKCCVPVIQQKNLKNELDYI
jgi:hypothetical protein